MSRRNKIIVWVAGSIAALILIVAIAAIVVLRTDWFRNYVREKVIAAVEVPK